MEALPRILRAYHDAPGEAGMSPFQIVFGRERSLAGVPCDPDRECEGATEFFDRLEEIDRSVARVLNDKHQRQADCQNQTRTPRPTFKVGEWVWVLRPRSSNVSKLDTWWVGPVKISARVGMNSYQVCLKPGVLHDVHADQLKPYAGDDVQGEPVKLHHYLSGYRVLETGSDEYDVETILRHRRGKDGKLQFLTQWENCDVSENTW